MAISIQVCNLALGEVRAPAITSIDDQNLEAATCARYYPMCLQSLLEVHEWSYATKIANLAVLSTNDRLGEYGFAYKLPTDFAHARRILGEPFYPSGVFYPWPYTYPRSEGWCTDFIIENDTLYSDYQTVQLEYVSNDLAESQMPMQFKKALALDLASYLAVALLNDSRLKGELIQHAEIEKQRAMAQDMNRQPRRDDMCFPRRRAYVQPTTTTTVTVSAPTIPATPDPITTYSLDFSQAANSMYIPLLYGL